MIGQSCGPQAGTAELDGLFIILCQETSVNQSIEIQRRLEWIDLSSGVKINDA